MRRVRLVSILLALLLAAGCISKGGGEGDDLAVANESSGFLDENESTVAPDGRGELSAFQETNRTVTNGTDAMEHKHDYWKGETRLIVDQWDSGLIPLPLIPEGKAPGTAIADYDIEAPNLVPEGTKQVELLFTRVRTFGTGDFAGPDVAHPALTIFVDYLSAADEPGAFRPAGQAEPDVPLIIPIEPQMADMPHQTKSLWVFRIYTGEANAWEYNLTITAVRGYDVVDWPPHPDLYAENTMRVIHDGPVQGEYAGDADNLAYGTDATWTFPQRIISYGTDTVTVTVEKGTWSAQWPEPTEWLLEVNNASYIPKVGNGAPAGLQLEPSGVDGTTYTFDVPVDPAGYDTPYGQHSRWSFRFVPAEDHGLPWAVDYNLKIVATGHSVATESLPS